MPDDARLPTDLWRPPGASFGEGLLIRMTADTIAISPPLVVSKAQIDEMADRIGDVLAQVA